MTATAEEKRAVPAVPNVAHGPDIVILLPDADIESRRVKL